MSLANRQKKQTPNRRLTMRCRRHPIQLGLRRKVFIGRPEDDVLGFLFRLFRIAGDVNMPNPTTLAVIFSAE